MQVYQRWMRIVGRLVFVLLLLVVGMSFQGCFKVEVVCPPSGGPSDPTGCSYPPASYNGSAVGFWNDSTNSKIPTGSTLTCGAGSNKCRAGSLCTDGSGYCTNHYLNGMCYCGCPHVSGS